MMFNLNIQREKRRTSGVYEIERHENSVRYLGTLDRLKDLAGTHLCLVKEPYVVRDGKIGETSAGWPEHAGEEVTKLVESMTTGLRCLPLASVLLRSVELRFRGRPVARSILDPMPWRLPFSFIALLEMGPMARR